MIAFCTALDRVRSTVKSRGLSCASSRFPASRRPTTMKKYTATVRAIFSITGSPRTNMSVRTRSKVLPSPCVRPAAARGTRRILTAPKCAPRAARCGALFGVLTTSQERIRRSLLWRFSKAPVRRPEDLDRDALRSEGELPWGRLRESIEVLWFFVALIALARDRERIANLYRAGAPSRPAPASISMDGAGSFPAWALDLGTKYQELFVSLGGHWDPRAQPWLPTFRGFLRPPGDRVDSPLRLLRETRAPRIPRSFPRP